MNLEKMGREAREAFRILSRTRSEIREHTVSAVAVELEARIDELRDANDEDVASARAAGLSEAIIDRLTLSTSRISAMIQDTHKLAALPDPVGETFDERTLYNGLQISRRRVPLGVIGVIYESRPNVTIDVATLAIKTGNTAILRGGKETIYSNLVLVDIVKAALRQNGLPEGAIQFIENPDRAWVGKLLRLNEFIDVIVPRGGSGLHEYCRKNATIPVITGGIGICHLFVDESANLESALPVIHNAKTQRPSVCNSLDTLLIHEKISTDFLPRVVENLAMAGVTFRAEPNAHSILDHPAVQVAGEEDFDTEWLSLVLGLKVVQDLDSAIDHIEKHGTHHSDGILTESSDNADQFLDQVDSAAVFVNASTRFTDGGQFGIGAEVAVSTQRIHARGPMGLPELTTYKWVVTGEYTSRE